MDVSIYLRAIKTAMAGPKAVKPLTPYACHHVCEALARCGCQMQCLELMRRYWGGMAGTGADTFCECFDEGIRGAFYMGIAIIIIAIVMRGVVRRVVC